MRKHKPTTSQNEPPNKISPECAQLLIQLHVAEYQALTNRCTYWISLQFAAVSVLLVYLGLVATVWNSLNHAFLIWGSAVVGQIVAIVWLQLLSEQYRVIRYLETVLRPMVNPLINEASSFWGYEPHLAEDRGTHPVWWEYSMTVPMLFIIVILIWLRRPFSSGDYFGLLLNIILFGFLVWQNVSSVNIRRSIFSASK